MSDELDPFKAMQTDLVQYAIEKKVEERMQHYLRTRVYPIASFVVAALAFFGFALKSLSGDFAKVNADLKEAKSMTGELRSSVSRLTNEANVAEAKLQTQQAYFAASLVQQLEMSRETSGLAARSEAAVKNLADARALALAEVDLAKKTVEQIQEKAKTAETAAANAKTNAEAADADIDAARKAAEKYEKAVTTQRRLLGRRIVDFAILVRKIPSTVQLENPRDESKRFVLTLSPQSVSRSGFKIDYAVGGVALPALPATPEMFGKWVELPGTDGLYNYMIDFVYQQRGVRNFLVVRFAGTDRMFEEEMGRQQQEAGK